MGQKNDTEFANLRSTVRESKHTYSDTEILTSRLVEISEPSYPHDAIHILPTN